MRGYCAHRSALALLTENLGIGLLPYVLAALCHPSIPWQMAVHSAVLVAGSFALSVFLVPRAEFIRDSRPIDVHRLLSCLLLGSSLAAIPWKQQALPCAASILGIGFGIRWCLFALETLELRRADQQREPLPCAATKLRRTCTIITGAVIPLLLIFDCPSIPLLWTSFGLTLFCQWTVVGEIFFSQGDHHLASSIPSRGMSPPHESDGGFS